VTTTAPQPIDTRPRAAIARRIPPTRGAASRDRTSWIEIVQETAPILDAPAFFGPPIIFVLGPWLLVALLLIGAFTLMVTVLLVLALAASLLAVCAVVIASPFLLIRHCRARSVAHSKWPGARHRFRNHRVGSSRLGTAHAKAHPIKEPSHA
jgi:hypothetical protein